MRKPQANKRLIILVMFFSIFLILLGVYSVFATYFFSQGKNVLLGINLPVECTNEFKCESCYDFLNGDPQIGTYPGGPFCRGVPFNFLQTLFINSTVIFIAICGAVIGLLSIARNTFTANKHFK